MLHRKLASLGLFIVITSLMNLYRTKVFRSSSFNEVYLDLYVMQHTTIVCLMSMGVEAISLAAHLALKRCTFFWYVLRK